MSLPDPAEKPFLTVEEAAALIGMSRSSAYEAVAVGTLPVVRFSAHRYRVPTAALRRMACIDETPAPAPTTEVTSSRGVTYQMCDLSA